MDRAVWIVVACAGCVPPEAALSLHAPTVAPITTEDASPTVEARDHVASIALAYERSCARFASGIVKCWGLGFDDAAHPHPIAIAGVSDAAQIAVGPTHACARTRSGRLRCWGSNDSGALGDGTREAALVAIDPGLDSVIDVGVGSAFTCATTKHGAACWGDNKRGTLGLGVVHDGELRPTPVPSLEHVQSFAIAGKHAFALATDGAVLGWGDGFGGGLKPTPFTLSALGKVRQIASSQSHACARLEGGSVLCFGNNDDGQLGDGTSKAYDGLVVAHGILDAVQIAIGDRATCVRHMAGLVSCWGSNELGQLGDGTTITRGVPAHVPGLSHVIDIGVGGSHACALIDDGSVQCWGSNRSGELGDRTRTPRSVRAPVIF